MYGRRYVWMLINDYVEKWWELSNDTTCSPEQLGHVTDGYFTIDSLSSLSEDEDSYANIVSFGVFVTPHERRYYILFSFEKSLWMQPYCLLGSGHVRSKSFRPWA